MLWQLKKYAVGFMEILHIYRQYIILLSLVVASIFLLQTNANPQLTYIRRHLLFMTAVVSRFQVWLPEYESAASVKNLKERNIELFKRNTVLEEAYLENIRLRKLIQFRDRFPLRTVPAHVLNKIPNPRLSVLILDAGYNKNVRMHDNVITDRGLAGKIIEVHENHSICELITDEMFRAAAKIQRTRLDGILRWEGRPNEMGFYGVIKNLDVRIGDVILTSEYSEYFLPNIPVGVVYEINNEVPGLFKDIRLKTFSDLNTIEEVFIVADTSRSVAARSGFEEQFLRNLK